MQEIERKQNSHGYDVFTIKTNDGSFEISFENNLDLYWRYINTKSMFNSPEKQEITITKENYFIYNLFYKLYESIKRNRVYYGLESNDYIEIRKDSNALFKDELIDWFSDDFYYENASRLIIQKEDEIFRVIFVKSKEEPGMFMTYSIRFRNSGSRYEPFNISFMNMYNELKEYDYDNHQIHIEEYLYKQKLLKK